MPLFTKTVHHPEDCIEILVDGTHEAWCDTFWEAKRFVRGHTCPKGLVCISVPLHVKLKKKPGTSWMELGGRERIHLFASNLHGKPDRFLVLSECDIDDKERIFRRDKE